MTGGEVGTLGVPPVSVVIASTGRAAEIALLLERLALQSLPPRRVVLSVVDEADVPEDAAARLARPGGVPGPALEIVRGAPGLCAQRNAALEALGPDALERSDEIVVFYDDDYVPALDALEGAARAFASNPGLVGCDGRVLADGVTGAGIGHDEAVGLIEAHAARGGDRPLVARPGLVGLYGCNMAYRGTAIGPLRFDERLPLYAWQEDVDFANRVMLATPGATLGRSDAFVGVHRGVKKARSPGRPLGYSQVANPLYLVRKGSMPRRFGWRMIGRNLVANALRAARPEPWVDRRGRLLGNLAGLGDLVAGRLDPARMLEMHRFTSDRTPLAGPDDAQRTPTRGARRRRRPWRSRSS